MNYGKCIKISIIIPCYNMKQYLPKCLESIQNQTLKEIEIICVDDGSSDGTAEFLEGYQKNHDNLLLFVQNNQGSGPARNYGMAKARGEYIAFMDADDFYPDDDILEYLYMNAVKNNANICGGSECIYKDGKYTQRKNATGTVFYEDGWIDKREFPTCGGYWRYLYKKSFLLNNNIIFPPYLRFQDPPFFVSAISKAGKVFCLKKVTYCYRKDYKIVLLKGKKGLDLMKGVRDCLVLSYEERLNGIYETLMRGVRNHDRIVVYQLVQNGVDEANAIIHEINQIINSANERDGRNDELLLEGEDIDRYLKKLESEKTEFQSAVRDFRKVLVYGAGNVGKRTVSLCRKMNIQVDAFVVSDIEKNPCTVDGLEVKSIDEYASDKDRCMVIVAVGEKLQQEILETLEEKKFRNVYLLGQEKLYFWESTT